MGLLDDAIREHLDLKRRHGADPAEVARLEREALGPGSAHDAARTSAPTREPEPSPPHDEAPAPPPPPSAVEPEAHGPPTRSEPGGTQEFSVEDEIFEPEPEHEPLEEEDGGEVVPADEEPDLLEETPDFLEETPEHDRLWFEQKPPRDFDFGG